MKNLMWVILISVGLIACLKDDFSQNQEVDTNSSKINIRTIKVTNTDSIALLVEQGLRLGVDTFSNLVFGMHDDVGMGGDRDYVVEDHYDVAYYKPTAIPNGGAQNDYLASLIVKHKDSSEVIIHSTYVNRVHPSGIKYVPTVMNSYVNHPAKRIQYKQLKSGVRDVNELRNERYVFRYYKFWYDGVYQDSTVKKPLLPTEKQWKPKVSF